MPEFSIKIAGKIIFPIFFEGGRKGRHMPPVAPPISYASIGTIPLSGLVSEIFSPKVPTTIIRDDVISDIIRPVSTIREDNIDTPYRGTLCLSIVQF